MKTRKRQRYPKCPRCGGTNTRQHTNFGMPMAGRGRCYDCNRTWDTVHADAPDYVKEAR